MRGSGVAHPALCLRRDKQAEDNPSYAWDVPRVRVPVRSDAGDSTLSTAAKFRKWT